jgi:hypothetical protein
MAAMLNGREEVSSGAHTDPLPGMRSKREAIPRGAQTDPLEANSWAFVTRQALRRSGPDSVDEEDSTDDGPIDEEELLRQRQETLNYLEGVLPVSPPTSYRASSVYSRDQWATDVRDQSETSQAATRQNMVAFGGKREQDDSRRWEKNTRRENSTRQDNNTSRDENRKRDHNRRREDNGRREDERKQKDKGKATEDSGVEGEWI